MTFGMGGGIEIFKYVHAKENSSMQLITVHIEKYAKGSRFILVRYRAILPIPFSIAILTLALWVHNAIITPSLGQNDIATWF